MASGIKVFYSWQSDLPNNTTRGFLQECIDAAVKNLKDTVAVEADRDTKGTFGSPDIVHTIFSKIDECDLFIADVSIVNKYTAVDDNGEKTEAIKLSPNPNVLLELGYAASTLTWDNVVCIMNTDYGEVGELPFDLEHRRPLQYSLKDKKRSEVKEYVRNIIVANILNVMEKGVRPKGDASSHIVGCFSFETCELTDALIPFSVKHTESYLKTYDELKEKCRALIEKIDKNKLVSVSEIETSDAVEEQIEETKEQKLSALAKQVGLYIDKGKPVTVKDEDKEWTRQQAKSLFGMTLDDDFFCLGNLKAKVSIVPYQATEYFGNDDEKTKYDDLEMLQADFYRIYLLESFVKTFDEVLLFPLAIHNNSSISDEDITISVRVDTSAADIIIPSKKLLLDELCGDEEYTGLEGFVYDEGYVKLLMMPENSEITYDTDISFDPSDVHKDLMRNAKDVFGNSTYTPDADDYEGEIKKFIATPTGDKNDTFVFEVDALRANERKWIGPLIALKPKSDEITLTYFIKSKKSSGFISSTLTYKDSK